MRTPLLNKLHHALRQAFNPANRHRMTPLTEADRRALSQAAWAQDTETVRSIITHCPQAVNGATDDGLTPLHCAAIGMNDSQMEWLVAKGAAIDARDREGNTPLHYAAQAHFAAGTDFLVQSGAEIDARNHKGETPLYYAIMFEQPANVSALIAAGAQETLARNDGETPLHLAPKDNKNRPGGTPPHGERPNMQEALAQAQAQRRLHFAQAFVLGKDIILRPAAHIRKRATRGLQK
ncbi:MAG: ankyrin repeat domain-containing protein [Bdellovibrionales bacterium]|jgi:ankyrin repeat protein|nr:ankyrin repeat domain-containing protein [Bdellovibrionales bacterium]